VHRTLVAPRLASDTRINDFLAELRHERLNMSVSQQKPSPLHKKSSNQAFEEWFRRWKRMLERALAQEKPEKKAQEPPLRRSA
jgi:hypothetical protein